MATEGKEGTRRRRLKAPGSARGDSHWAVELQRQKQLLKIEYGEEKAAFSKITERIGLNRLAERGDAWIGIKPVRTYYNSLNQRVLEVVHGTDKNSEEEEPETIDHHFEYGRPVAFFSLNEEGTPKTLFSGTVSFADARRLVATIPDSAQTTLLDDSPLAGVMLSFDETTYRAMFEALDRVLDASGRLAELRNLFYSRQPAREYVDVGVPRLPYLNSSQQEAVEKVLHAKDVAVVHGPPGTGKTTTLVEAIHETLRRESQAMVCAQSNMAVDWICEQLTARGLHVLRLGNPSRVTDNMLAHTYEHRFEAHPDYPTLWRIRRDIRLLQSVRSHRSEQWHQKISRLRSRATELEFRINADLFNSAHVVASTLVGSNNKVLSGMRFSTLFIDEAAQAMEAACWIAIRRAGKVVFAGDHHQLPPTVKSFEAMKGGLGKSLMERIVENHPEAVTLLTTQYRMHRGIMSFPNKWFYHGRMKAAPEVASRGILDFDNPIEWIDTDLYARAMEEATATERAADAFRETEAGESHGRINRDEAALTLLTLQTFISRIGKQRFLEERLDVGLISPYRAQAQYQRKMLRRLDFFHPYRKAITVDTVDGFQGQERDIIVVSLVRSNDEGQIGFLRDLRRMNVAITRARMKLLIIGNASTLGRHPFYRELIEEIGRQKSGEESVATLLSPIPAEDSENE